MRRDESLALLKPRVSGEGLINHCIVTEAVMKAVAVRLGEDQDEWESGFFMT